VLGGLMTLLTVPLFFLNMFGGMVSGIWLMILGRWGEFGLGIFILFAGSFLLGLVIMPSFLLQAGGGALLQKGKSITGFLLMLLGGLWIYFVVYIWCGATFVTMIDGANGHPWPLALWGYANAVGPWAYMASKDREATGSTIVVFVAQLGCVSMMIGYLFLHATPNVVGLAPYLLPFIGLGALAQIALGIAMVWALKADEKIGRLAGSSGAGPVTGA
jgi:hypothetical protein